MKTLRLTLKRKRFDMILEGKIKEEYREIREFWARRLIDFGEEMEPSVLEEMVHDMNDPHFRHEDTAKLMEYFGVKFKEFEEIEFRNGYGKDAPRFRMNLCGIMIRVASGWGAEVGKFYFTLLLGEIIKESQNEAEN